MARLAEGDTAVTIPAATRADLHIHTTASDGTWTPAQLIAAIKQAGIGLFAVTDHDTVAAVAASAHLAAAAGVPFIPGVEVSATWRGRSFHILGYGVSGGSGSLARLLRHNAALLEEADDDSVRKLIAQGLPVDYAEYRAYRHDPRRGGWKSLSFLCDKGLCQDVGDFFARLFTPARGIVFPDFPRPAAVIAAIRDAGGVAVLAHPASEFHGSALAETLDLFRGESIDGIECFHPGHSAADTAQAARYCQAHRLLITGGSDCHGAFVAGRRLGVPAIRLAQLRLGALRRFLT